MKLCFLDAHTFDGGAVRGSALVTDERTRPLEFRLTDPVVPTELQRLLYGAVLDEHVLGDLCAVPLLDALREAPDAVLVRDQTLLGLQDLRDVPVLWIGRDEDAEPGATDEADRPPGVLLGYHGDGEDEALKSVRLALREISERYDLLEPFERMQAAVAQVHRGEVAAAS
ncbi:MAG: hypothetical protein IPM29_02050 [Planctomycetes bacterium]|nr:hypothetical protein [Planctomycetota bacterium]